MLTISFELSCFSNNILFYSYVPLLRLILFSIFYLSDQVIFESIRDGSFAYDNLPHFYLLINQTTKSSKKEYKNIHLHALTTNMVNMDRTIAN